MSASVFAQPFVQCGFRDFVFFYYFCYAFLSGFNLFQNKINDFFSINIFPENGK